MKSDSGVVSALCFILKVFRGVTVRVLCRSLEFNLGKPRLHGARRGLVMLGLLDLHC